MAKLFLSFYFLSAPFFAYAVESNSNTLVSSKDISDERKEKFAQKNRKLRKFRKSRFFELHEKNLVARRPYAEYERAETLIFSEVFYHSSKDIKLKIAENLPKDVDLLIYTKSKEQNEEMRVLFKDSIDEDRLYTVNIENLSNPGFWTRDALPIPTIDIDSGKLQLIDADYYYDFTHDDFFAKIFEAELDQHPYSFEGGNFISNHLGDCIIVNNKTAIEIPTSLFEKTYGCSSLIRLPHINGIGHIDERVKFCG